MLVCISLTPASMFLTASSFSTVCFFILSCIISTAVFITPSFSDMPFCISLTPASIFSTASSFSFACALMFFTTVLTFSAIIPPNSLVVAIFAITPIFPTSALVGGPGASSLTSSSVGFTSSLTSGASGGASAAASSIFSLAATIASATSFLVSYSVGSKPSSPAILSNFVRMYVSISSSTVSIIFYLHF